MRTRCDSSESSCVVQLLGFVPVIILKFLSQDAAEILRGTGGDDAS